MAKRSSKKTPRDVNALAAFIIEKVTRESAPDPNKNPHAVALGRLGGQKGGKARADKLSKEQRSEIARRAALARWKR